MPLPDDGVKSIAVIRAARRFGNSVQFVASEVRAVDGRTASQVVPGV